MDKAITDEIVYCQISGGDISVDACQALQNEDQCVGCAASSRLCVKCNNQNVTFPQVEFCEKCLQLELANEKEYEKSIVGLDDSVLCQVTGNKIGAKACQVMQNPDACQKCASPFRYCEECQKRAVKYPDFGLCLHCQVKKYGTKKNKIEKGEEKMADRPIKKTKNKKKKKQTTKKLCVQCNKNEAYHKKSDLCQNCYWIKYSIETQELDKKGPCEITGKPIRKIACRKSIGPAVCQDCHSPFKKCRKCSQPLTKWPNEGFCDQCKGMSKIKRKGKYKKRIKNAKPSRRKAPIQPMIIDYSMTKKIETLKNLCQTFGESDLTLILQSMINDLRQLQNIKEAIKK